jgi:hypothetical protein
MRPRPSALLLAAAAQGIEAATLLVAAVLTAADTAAGRSYQRSSGIALTIIAFGAVIVVALIAVGIYRARRMGTGSTWDCSRCWWRWPVSPVCWSRPAGVLSPSTPRALRAPRTLPAPGPHRALRPHQPPRPQPAGRRVPLPSCAPLRRRSRPRPGPPARPARKPRPAAAEAPATALSLPPAVAPRPPSQPRRLCARKGAIACRRLHVKAPSRTCAARSSARWARPRRRQAGGAF